MKKFLCFALLVLTLSSCSTKMSAVSDLRKLTNDVELYGSEYSVQDWQNAKDRYLNINDRLQQYTYTAEQRKEISTLKGELAGYFAKGVVGNITNKVNDVKTAIESFRNVLGF